jgi:U-box domain
MVIMDGCDTDSTAAATPICYERSAILKALQSASLSSSTGRRPFDLSCSTDFLVLNKELQWKIKFWVKKHFQGSYNKANASITTTSTTTTAPAGTAAPLHFYCPLSQQVMDDPVHHPSTSSVSFERQYILQWLQHVEEKCPVTGNFLSRQSLVRHAALADEIDAWKRQQQQLQQQQQQQERRFMVNNNKLTTSRDMPSSMAFRVMTMLDSLPPMTTMAMPRRYGGGDGSDTDTTTTTRLEDVLSLLDEAIACVED